MIKKLLHDMKKVRPHFVSTLSPARRPAPAAAVNAHEAVV